jgi:hypothetical protein
MYVPLIATVMSLMAITTLMQLVTVDVIANLM